MPRREVMFLKRRKKKNRLEKELDKQTIQVADKITKASNNLGDVPVVGKVSKRWRDRITGYTNNARLIISDNDNDIVKND